MVVIDIGGVRGGFKNHCKLYKDQINILVLIRTKKKVLNLVQTNYAPLSFLEFLF